LVLLGMQHCPSRKADHITVTGADIYKSTLW